MKKFKKMSSKEASIFAENMVNTLQDSIDKLKTLSVASAEIAIRLEDILETLIIQSTKYNYSNEEEEETNEH